MSRDAQRKRREARRRQRSATSGSAPPIPVPAVAPEATSLSSVTAGGASTLPATPAGERLRPVTSATWHLAELVHTRELAREAVDVEVAALRVRGVSWPVIAAALGVTRQAARQRYTHTTGLRGDGDTGASTGVHDRAPMQATDDTADEMTDPTTHPALLDQ